MLNLGVNVWFWAHNELSLLHFHLSPSQLNPCSAPVSAGLAELRADRESCSVSYQKCDSGHAGGMTARPINIRSLFDFLMSLLQVLDRFLIKMV